MKQRLIAILQSAQKLERNQMTQSLIIQIMIAINLAEEMQAR